MTIAEEIMLRPSDDEEDYGAGWNDAMRLAAQIATDGETKLRAEVDAAGEALRLARQIAASVRIARSSLGPHADVGHLEAVALRYVRWSDLANLEAALAKIGVE